MQKNRFFIMILLVMAINFTYAQVTLPHYEAFDYTVGDSLPMHGWIGLNGGDQILVTAGSLSYDGLAAPTGNKVSFDGSGRDFQKTITAQTSGTVYMSYIMQVTNLGTLNATGGYFTGLGSATTMFGSTNWIKLNGAGFSLGLNARSSAAYTTWDATLLNTNDSVFVVVSYEMVSGTTNDIANMWINPAASSFGGTTPPTPTITITNGGTDLTQIDRFFLRQDNVNTTPFLDIDEIRVGTSWADVTPPSGVGIKETSKKLDFQLYPNPSNGKFNLIMASNTPSNLEVSIFNTLGSMVYTQTNITTSTTVDLSNLNKGIYFVQLKDKKTAKVNVKKMVIQ